MNAKNNDEKSKHHTCASIVVVEDHHLVRKGLLGIISRFGTYEVLFDANNGKDFINKLNPHVLPDIVLMNVVMPEMDGIETTLWLKNHHPQVKVLALSMHDDVITIIRMFKAGAKGYLLKDCNPSELQEALNCIVTKGFYCSEMITRSFIQFIIEIDEDDTHVKKTVNLNELEITFLKLACTELTYTEIADKMCKSLATIEGYRSALFQKLNVKTRSGLVIYALKNGL